MCLYIIGCKRGRCKLKRLSNQTALGRVPANVRMPERVLDYSITQMHILASADKTVRAITATAASVGKNRQTRKIRGRERERLREGNFDCAA